MVIWQNFGRPAEVSHHVHTRVHTFTTLIRPSRILCSKNANSVLNVLKKSKILRSKIEILHSENANFALKKYSK